ncbi:TPA: type 1 fimbrial protein [Klebsiella aerogenes]|uniref:type 1 fimbrial protein n=1 Tax=Klebsiella aerogenes TaxID=548 RepID=UPI0007A9DEE6|nr:type 1 fimbrial protein [Klebsiella aerogenes]EKU7552757.1 type 1 fimbrial protein [Klebsiella aerogenes]EKZ9809611.1 type 1 fimbrial protein [Klebsiella aerogenes]ELA0205304.1 type 1 fimbrial protein [Klebsiella aerogenes]ELA0226405.1 type 1 fimbrial protein [Klebsiella aerogenes]SAJ83354.1 fimbrial protein domain-containing protein [Klebsiella aerogenes]
MIKKIHALAMPCLMLSCLFGAVHAAPTDGVVAIYGLVVDPSCEANSVGDKIEMACPQLPTRTLSPRVLITGNYSNDAVRSAQLKYIDPQHTRAILEVNYR